jgi:hypothetical protein
MKVKPINVTEEHRGVAYTVVGDYANAERTGGNFQGRCRCGSAYGGSPDAVRQQLQRLIDTDLDAEKEAKRAARKAAGKKAKS